MQKDQLVKILYTSRNGKQRLGNNGGYGSTDLWKHLESGRSINLQKPASGYIVGTILDEVNGVFIVETVCMDDSQQEIKVVHGFSEEWLEAIAEVYEEPAGEDHGVVDTTDSEAE